LAHTLLHAPRGGTLTLDAALAHLAADRFEAVTVNVDVKHVGCEAALIDSLRRHRLLDRALLSSQVPTVVDRLRERERQLRLGISVGGRLARIGRRWRGWRDDVLDGLARGRWHVLMAQHRLVDRGLLAQVEARGCHLYAWTVNDRAVIATLRELGVHGVATADPRLFAPVDAVLPAAA
ncbi:MAG: glycerophosphodiester phosphodiesterase, partial [Solirubrobacteraceae bacterium]